MEIRRSSLPLEDLEISFIESGDGKERVLLFHASGSDALQWKALMKEECDYHFIAPDFSWYGKNKLLPDPQNATKLDLKIVEKFIQEYSPCHVVGHAYGATLLLDFLQNTREKILSATLIEPVSFHLIRRFDPKGFEEISHLVKELWDEKDERKYLKAAKKFVHYWTFPLAWTFLGSKIKKYMELRMEKIVYEFLPMYRDVDRLRFKYPITYPVFLIQGQWTKKPTASVISYLERFFHTTATVVPSAGHLAPITQATPVAEVILENISGQVHPKESVSEYPLQ